MSRTTNTFSPSVRKRAVRQHRRPEARPPSTWPAVMAIAAKIGCRPRTRNDRVKGSEVDNGHRAGSPAELTEWMKALEPENREPQQAIEIVRKASAGIAMLEGRAASLRAMPARSHRRS